MGSAALVARGGGDGGDGSPNLAPILLENPDTHWKLTEMSVGA